MLRMGALVLGGVAVVSFLLFPYLDRGDAEGIGALSGPGIAEVRSAKGGVEVRRRGRPAWERVAAGTVLFAGDLVRTGSRGSAELRFEDRASASLAPDTIVAIRPSGDAGRGGLRDGASGSAYGAGGASGAQGAGARRSGSGDEPMLEVREIVPFGLTLEIVGSVDPGTSLMANGEKVEVSGDGGFKHFTRPFPRAGTVQVVLKATDLAGRTRVVTRTARVE
jgi:hypothetical protein